MSKTFVISQEDKKVLQDIQVAFKVEHWGLIVIEQIEVMCTLTGDYQMLNLDTFSKRGTADLEEICRDWYNEQDFGKEYSQDDNNPPPRAA